MTYKALAVAIVLSITATTAVAQDTRSQKPGKGQVAAGAKKYCVKYKDITGTRIAREECRTKKEWANEGVQIDGKKAS